MRGVREGTDKSEKRRGRGEKERERRRGREREGEEIQKNVCYLSLALGRVTSDCQVTNEWSPAIERDL